MLWLKPRNSVEQVKSALFKILHCEHQNEKLQKITFLKNILGGNLSNEDHCFT